MDEGAYRWTSGRMLHLEGCEHFDDDQPPRLATTEELRSLRVCNTCAGRSPGRSTSTGSSSVTSAVRFTCPECFVSHPLAMQTPSGRCRGCAD